MRSKLESVQIIRNDLIIDYAKDRFPHLWNEVYEHDKISQSSWYNLTPEAWTEFIEFGREYPV
jgi:hypothetical protein